MSGTVIPLKKPIKAHGEETSELTLREPTTEDVMDIGQPFLVVMGDGETAVRVQQKVVGAWIVRLAGVPLSSVKAMDIGDFGKAQAVVLGFFGQGSDEAANS